MTVPSSAAGALDLDDLVARTVELLERDAAVRHTLQQRFRWLSVDEYQDVNAAQYRLLRLLAGGGANLCVIGDPDQAIYGFRGADHRYFLSYRRRLPRRRDPPPRPQLSLSTVDSDRRRTGDRPQP